MCTVLWEPQGQKATLVESISREDFKEEVSFRIHKGFSSQRKRRQWYVKRRRCETCRACFNETQVVRLDPALRTNGEWQRCGCKDRPRFQVLKGLSRHEERALRLWITGCPIVACWGIPWGTLENVTDPDTRSWCARPGNQHFKNSASQMILTQDPSLENAAAGEGG